MRESVTLQVCAAVLQETIASGSQAGRHIPDLLGQVTEYTARGI